MSVSADPRKTLSGTSFPAVTFASLPAAANSTGLIYRVTDVGENGALLISNGTRWRPVSGRTVLKTLAATVSGLTNTEAISLQALIPAGLLQTPDMLRVRFASGKSGTTDTGNVTIRMGTAGTTSDTAITGISNQSLIQAGNQCVGVEYELKVVSATSVVRCGYAGNLSGTTGQSAGSFTAATTVTDMSANALYLSLAHLSGGATNTLTLHSASIEWVTP